MVVGAAPRCSDKETTMTDTNKQTAPKASRPKRFARQPAEAGNSAAETPKPEAGAATPAPAKVNKTEQVLSLLRREDGATLAEITEATGWLSHSARAVLTGLRKKGHVLEKGKRGQATCYSILPVAQ
jgi:hypothetical protein